MKRIFLTLGIVLAFLSLGISEASAETYKVDASSSSSEWDLFPALFLAPVSSGSIEFSGDKVTGGVFEINLSSTTLKEVPNEFKEKSEKILKSEEGLNVVKFPTVKLEIGNLTKATPVFYETKAKLTIKGTTKDVTLLIGLEIKDGVYSLVFPFSFSAKDFGIKKEGFADYSRIDVRIVAKK